MRKELRAMHRSRALLMVVLLQPSPCGAMEGRGCSCSMGSRRDESALLYRKGVRGQGTCKECNYKVYHEFLVALLLTAMVECWRDGQCHECCT